MAKSDGRQAFFGAMRTRKDHALESQPLDERVHRLAHDRPEDAMKMKRREVGQPRTIFQGEVARRDGRRYSPSRD